MKFERVDIKAHTGAQTEAGAVEVEDREVVSRIKKLATYLRDTGSAEATRFANTLETALEDQGPDGRALSNLGILERILNVIDLPDLPVATADLVEQPGGRRKLEQLLAAKPDKANELASEILEAIQQLQVGDASEDFRAAA